tara:strand:+ start:2830 stop:3657 length:828 start_codon:yes stop_codon:yes gene_type:complete
LKKILLIGASGFLGSYFYNRLKLSKDYFVCGTFFNNYNKNLVKLDYTDFSNFKLFLNKINPDIIVWSAGQKNVKLLEQDFSIAEKNNLKPIKTIINFQQTINKNVQFIFISSDYVFNGYKGNYSDIEQPKPDTNYGKSKYIAEQLIQEKSKLYSIIRVGSILGRGSKFFDWLVEGLNTKLSIDLYDEIVSPTPLEMVYLALERCIEKNLIGIFHISGNRNISKFQIGLELKESLSDCKTSIKEIKKNKSRIINRSLKRSKEFSDFKNLELKELLN